MPLLVELVCHEIFLLRIVVYYFRLGRQVLAEFVGKGDFPVLIINSENRQTTETTMDALLPFTLSIQDELHKLQHQ